MHDTRSKLVVFAALAGLVALAVTGALFLLAPSDKPSAGPVPIVFDHEACTECRMSIGEPRYAAQIQTTDGRVLDFDDPGCLMAYEKAEHPKEAAVWFHGAKGSEWIRARDVGFVKGGPTPMGYDLIAVPRAATPGAISLALARVQVGRRSAHRMKMQRGSMAAAEDGR